MGTSSKLKKRTQKAKKKAVMRPPRIYKTKSGRRFILSKGKKKYIKSNLTDRDLLYKVLTKMLVKPRRTRKAKADATYKDGDPDLKNLESKKQSYEAQVMRLEQEMNKQSKTMGEKEDEIQRAVQNLNNLDQQANLRAQNIASRDAKLQRLAVKLQTLQGEIASAQNAKTLIEGELTQIQSDRQQGQLALRKTRDKMKEIFIQLGGVRGYQLTQQQIGEKEEQLKQLTQVEDQLIQNNKDLVEDAKRLRADIKRKADKIKEYNVRYKEIKKQDKTVLKETQKRAEGLQRKVEKTQASTRQATHSTLLTRAMTVIGSLSKDSIKFVMDKLGIAYGSKDTIPNLKIKLREGLIDYDKSFFSEIIANKNDLRRYFNQKDVSIIPMNLQSPPPSGSGDADEEEADENAQDDDFEDEVTAGFDNLESELRRMADEPTPDANPARSAGQSAITPVFRRVTTRSTRPPVVDLPDSDDVQQDVEDLGGAGGAIADDDSEDESTAPKARPARVRNPNLRTGNGRTKKISNGLYNDEIDEIMKRFKKYAGCVSLDEMDQLKVMPVMGFILNTQPSHVKDGHWVAVYIDTKKQHVLEYYDSFAEDPPKSFMKDVKQIIDTLNPSTYLKFKINRIKDQRDDTSSCGWMAMSFLMRRFNGVGWKECTGWNTLQGEKRARLLAKKYGYI